MRLSAFKDCKRVFKLMGDDYVSIKFESATNVCLVAGDYLYLPSYGRFVLTKDYRPKLKTGNAGFQYDIQFDAAYKAWGNKILKFSPSAGASETSFTLTAPIGQHARIILENLRSLGYCHYGDGSDYVAVCDGSIDSVAKAITYQSLSILDAIAEIAKQFDTEWWVENNEIHFGKCYRNTGERIFEPGVNVEEVTPSSSGEQAATRVYAFGSDKNIPKDYRKDLYFENGLDGEDAVEDKKRPIYPSYLLKKQEEEVGELDIVTDTKYTRTILKNLRDKDYHLYCKADAFKDKIYLRQGDYCFSPQGFAVNMPINPDAVRLRKEDAVYDKFRLTVQYDFGLHTDKGTETLSRSFTYDSKDPKITSAFHMEKFSLNYPITSIRITLWYYIYTDGVYELAIKIPDKDKKEEPLGMKGKVSFTNQVVPQEIKDISIELYHGDDTTAQWLDAGNWSRIDGCVADCSKYPLRITVPGTTVAKGTKYRIPDIVKRCVPASFYSPVMGTEIVANGVVTNRLMLPVDTPYVDVEEGLDDARVIEKVVTFEEEYPKLDLYVTDVESYESTVTNEDGGKQTETFFRIKDSQFYFDPDWMLDGQKLHVVFSSGLLNGMDFEVQYKSEGEWFELIANENYGRKLPDTVLCPSDDTDNGTEDGVALRQGDRFALYGWDTRCAGDTGMVLKAEEKLLAKTRRYVEKMRIDPSDYNCSMMSDYMELRGKTADGWLFPFNVGDRIVLRCPAYFPDGERKSRVIGYELDLAQPYKSSKITLGDKPNYSKFGEMKDNIDALTIRLNDKDAGSATGGSPYIIGMGDLTPYTDGNVLSALRSESSYLRRNTSDRTPHQLAVGGKLTAEGGVQFGMSFVPDIAGGLGGFIDSDGAGELKSLMLREFLEVPELRYNRVDITQGVSWNAPGAGIVERFMPGASALAFQMMDAVYPEPDGGYTRNLLLNAEMPKSGLGYLVGTYDLAADFGLKPGDEATLTLWGKLGDGKVRFEAFNSGGMIWFGPLTQIADGVFQLKFKWNNVNADGLSPSDIDTSVWIYAMPSGVTGVTSDIYRIKLEAGWNDNPVWSPYPSATKGAIRLKLEDGEYGSFKEGDICMGVWHLESGNNATDYDNGHGEMYFTGFTTLYFKVTGVAGDRNEYVEIQARETWGLPVQPSLNFVAYGNDEKNPDGTWKYPERQKSCYRTRSYTRFLSGVTDYNYGVACIAAQFGDLTNLTVNGKELSGYSAYLNNVYFTGILQKIEAESLLQLRLDPAGHPYAGDKTPCIVALGVTKGLTYIPPSKYAVTDICKIDPDDGTDVYDQDTDDLMQSWYDAATGVLTIPRTHLAGANTVDFKVTVSLKDEDETATAQLRVYDAAILKGDQGQTGPAGAVVRGPVLWEKGRWYYDGDTPDDNGMKWLDTVYLEDSYGNRQYFRCINTHADMSDNDMPNSGESGDIWEQMNDIGNIYANTLFAENAKIRFGSMQEIVFLDTQDGVLGRIGAPLSDGTIMYLGGSTAETATYRVSDNGLTRFGKSTGKRIEIDPDSERIRVYDADNCLKVLVDSSANDLSSIYHIAGDSIRTPLPDTPHAASGAENLGTFPAGEKGATLTVTAQVSLIVDGYRAATETGATTTEIAPASATAILEVATDTTFQNIVADASVSLAAEVSGSDDQYVYDENGLYRSFKTQVKTLYLAHTFAAGTYYVRIRYDISAGATITRNGRTVQSSASAGVTSFSKSLTAAPHPMTVVSTNGVISALSTTHYLRTVCSGNTFRVEAKAGNYGLIVDSNGIHAWDKDANNGQGDWHKLKLTFE